MDSHVIITPAHGTTGAPPAGPDSGNWPAQKPGTVVQQVPAVRLVPGTQPTATAGTCSIKKRSCTLNAGSPDPQRLIATIDFSDPHLPINFVAPDYRPLDQQMPRPSSSPALKADTWLNWAGSKPETAGVPASLNGQDPEDYVRSQLLHRQHIEAAGGRFAFEPLMITLENMHSFIHHIQAGDQFPDALNAAEAAALTRLEIQTRILVQARAPWYKDSVCLALSLMALCELVTERQVLEPLRLQQPTLGLSLLTRPCCRPQDREHMLAALPWTPLPSDGPDFCESADPLSRYLLEGLLSEALFRTVHDRTVLLYPSFHPLTLENFVRFSHLPLYPIGLTADYACGADGFLMSPLAFANHDLDHMFRLREDTTCQATAVETLLTSARHRFALRQMLLDNTPGCLAGQALEPALILLLFTLVHERAPSTVALGLKSSCSAFWYFLQQLLDARRLERTSFTDQDLRYTDRTAAMAALWTSWLWEHWQQANYQLTREQVQHLARLFAHQQAPLLEQHMDFIAQHRGTLRQLFIDSWSYKTGCRDNRYCFSLIMPPHSRSLTLFQNHCGEECGLRHLDNTDLAYFWALHLPEWRLMIEKATHSRLPDRVCTSSIA